MAIEDTLTLGIVGILSMLILATFIDGLRPSIASLLDNATNFPNAALELAIFDLILLVFVFIIILGMIKKIRDPNPDQLR